MAGGRRKPRDQCPVCITREMIFDRSICDTCWKALPAWFRRKLYKLSKALDPWYDRRNDAWLDKKIETERAQFEPLYKAYKRARDLQFKLAVRCYRRTTSPEQLEAREKFPRGFVEQSQHNIDAERQAESLPVPMREELRSLGLI